MPPKKIAIFISGRGSNFQAILTEVKRGKRGTGHGGRIDIKPSQFFSPNPELFSYPASGIVVNI